MLTIVEVDSVIAQEFKKQLIPGSDRRQKSGQYTMAQRL